MCTNLALLIYSPFFFQKLPRDDINAFFAGFDSHDAHSLKKLDPGDDSMFMAEVRRFWGFGSGKPRMRGAARSTSAALIMLPFLVRDMLARLVNSPPAILMPRDHDRSSAPEEWTKVSTTRFHHEGNTGLTSAAALHGTLRLARIASQSFRGLR